MSVGKGGAAPPFCPDDRGRRCYPAFFLGTSSFLAYYYVDLWQTRARRVRHSRLFVWLAVNYLALFVAVSAANNCSFSAEASHSRRNQNRLRLTVHDTNC